jgi:hypothetical protein
MEQIEQKEKEIFKRQKKARNREFSKPSSNILNALIALTVAFHELLELHAINVNALDFLAAPKPLLRSSLLAKAE